MAEEDGRVLFNLIVENNYTQALDIGTSTGHSAIWIAWATIVWRCFADDARKRAIAGLFFVTPFYLLLPRIAILDGLVAPTEWAGPGRGAGVLAAAVIALAGWLLRRRVGVAAACLATVPLGLVGFSAARLAEQPALLVTIGGLLFPAAVVFVIGDRSPRAAWLAAVLVLAGLIQSPLWLIGAMAVFVIQAIRQLETGKIRWPMGGWVALLALHVLTILSIFIASFPTLIPKFRFDTDGQALFSVGRQLIPPSQRPAGKRGEVR